MAEKITWWHVAETIGISDLHMRRWQERYDEFGFRGYLTGLAGLPRNPDILICQEQYFVVGYEDIVSGGPSHEFSSPTT